MHKLHLITQLFQFKDEFYDNIMMGIRREG